MAKRLTHDGICSNVFGDRILETSEGSTNNITPYTPSVPIKMEAYQVDLNKWTNAEANGYRNINWADEPPQLSNGSDFNFAGSKRKLSGSDLMDLVASDDETEISITLSLLQKSPPAIVVTCGTQTCRAVFDTTRSYNVVSINLLHESGHRLSTIGPSKSCPLISDDVGENTILTDVTSLQVQTGNYCLRNEYFVDRSNISAGNTVYLGTRFMIDNQWSLDFKNNSTTLHVRQSKQAIATLVGTHLLLNHKTEKKTLETKMLKPTCVVEGNQNNQPDL